MLRASSGSDPAGSCCGGFGAPSSTSIGSGAGAGAPIGGWGGVGLAVATRRRRAREAWGRREEGGQRTRGELLLVKWGLRFVRGSWTARIGGFLLGSGLAFLPVRFDLGFFRS